MNVRWRTGCISASTWMGLCAQSDLEDRTPRSLYDREHQLICTLRAHTADIRAIYTAMCLFITHTAT